MTKAQIVSHFAKKFEFSRKTSSAILEEVTTMAITETKKRPGLYGKLVRFEHKARMGRNPAKGAEIKIPG